MTSPINYNTELLAKIVSAEQNSLKFKCASLCDKIGLLQFRVVRWLFSITDEKIKKINDIFVNKLVNKKEDIDFKLREGEWRKICKRWGLKVNSDSDDKNIEKIRQQFPQKDIFNNNPIDPDKKLKEVLELLLQNSPKLDPKPANFFTSLNARSVRMKDHLSPLPNYIEKSGILKIEGKDFRVIDSEVNEFNIPLVSCGLSSSREMILLDPNNSPLLLAHYNNFDHLIARYMQGKGKDQLSPEDLINITNMFMCNCVFPRSNNMESQVDDLVEKCKQDPTISKVNFQPCIPIDVFLKEKSGVCRHHALVGAYLLDRYIQEHADTCSFKGKVQIMRDNVNGFLKGGHAWLTLVCSNNKNFCIDTLNEISGDLGDSNFRETTLQDCFGAKAVEHQLEKAKQLRERHSSLRQ